VAAVRQDVRRTALILVGLVALAVTAITGQAPADANAPINQKIGIVCTHGEGGVAGQPVFNLTTKTGYISLPDGNTSFMWGYSAGFDGFQHPGPVLCVTEGDQVTVILHNTFQEPVSIAFPGQHDVLADGVPNGPEVDATPKATSLATAAAPNGGTVTYTFTADHAGTFLYESGTNPEKQVRMGLFGALIVRPADGTGGERYAYDSTDSQFEPTEEFMVMLSEIDPYQHQAVEQGRNFNINNYHPRYWLINGRGFPDSIADNGASWLPTQPYGALAEIHEFDLNGDLPSMARYLNVGTEDYPFHPHGNNGLVIGRDGHELKGAGGEDLSMEKFDINVGPGQTWDVIFKWYDAEHYDPVDNPVPVTVPSLANSVIGAFYSGSPYLGNQKTLPTGSEGQNQCGEYYIISHNHALYQITSWGVNMTGPITYMRIDPPAQDHNTCGQ
jgi:FtsP/CotA-like multicopper oxidase with cupredoxin domain